MRQLKKLFLLGAAVLFAIQLPAQVTNYVVQVSATAQSSPALLTFTWTADANATGYDVYRKTQAATSWGIAITSLPGTATTWTDSTLSTGDEYEYKFQKNAPGYTGYGYVFGGIEAPATESRGILLLVIDTTYLSALVNELQQLREDLTGDGWSVQNILVDRNDPVATVKSLIVQEYNNNPSLVKCVYLFGHVPVPYSGNIAPDGHVPDHQGAWPADAFYGELNGTWTDGTVNNTGANRPENQNAPGDGKYDQNLIPTEVELQVGRVDFANMSSFPEGEQELLRRYLNKAHNWRHGMIAVTTRAVVDDNFGVFTGPPLENFASSGFRNFSSLVGQSNVTAGDYRTNMLGGLSCLWSYGCGAGTYQSASGVTTTADFVNDSLAGIFTMIFGSYHGDWDVANNLMRASLASKGNILTCAWAGRPTWHYHHTGLGENIGYSARITMNNTGSLYIGNYGTRQVHMAQLGDPALRIHVVKPISSLAITAVNSGRDNELTWSASPDATDGYYIYREDGTGNFIRITPSPVAATTYTDPCVNGGTNRYMVRALRLQTCTSGSYYNLSQGIFGEIINTASFTLDNVQTPALSFCPNESFNLMLTSAGPFCGANDFTAELSDATGSFASPTVIGVVNDTLVQTIPCVIPAATAPGTGYRIRVTTQIPLLISPDNGSDITIEAMPTAFFTWTQNGPIVSFSDGSSAATSLLWNFGDGNTSTDANPVHTFTQSGNFTVTLIATNSCGSDTITQSYTIVGTENAWIENKLNLFPVPSSDRVTLNWNGNSEAEIFIHDLAGRKIMEFTLQPGENKIFNVSGWAAGIYSAKIISGSATGAVKFAVE